MSVPAVQADPPHHDLARTYIERFRAAIVQHIGLQFDDGKIAFLGEVLQRRAGRHGTTPGTYLDRFEAVQRPNELRALARELTVGETYFFRHYDQFRALAEVALPDALNARQAAKSLRLLSAGCSSGEEAYSLAIIARETIADPSWRVEVRAVDLNPVALEKAARARYSAWALREAPAELRERWFRAEGRDLLLDESLRGAVQFGEGNLAGDDAGLWQPYSYDVVFCRNVLMYFAPEQMRAAIARIAGALTPGGYLFLGHAETLRGISDDFHLCHSHETFYYRRKDGDASARRDATPAFIRAAVRAEVPPPPTTPAVDWFNTIRQASERVTALVAAADKGPSAGTAAPLPDRGWKLAPVFEFLRQERFGEALDHVRRGSPQADNDPDVLLVKAVLLAQAGQGAEAEAACQALLLRDELNAGAHYVLALCREQAGDLGRAMEHDRVAAHLDPAFAMPRLHCGLLARQAGDRATARRELQQALVLLKREDVARLLLFGGGFTRDALIALAQSTAVDCGGRR